MAKAPTTPAGKAIASGIEPVTIPKRKGRPKSGLESSSKVFYFKDATLLKEFDQLLYKHPRSSGSGIVQQLIQQLLKAHGEVEKKGPVDHKIESTFTIYL